MPELALERDPHTVTVGVLDPLDRHVEVDRAHDPVAEVLVDQGFERRAVDLQRLVEAVDRRVGRGQLTEGAARRDLLQDRGGVGVTGQLEQFDERVGGLGVERMLTEQRGGRPHAVALQRIGDRGIAQPLGALGIEDLLGELLTGHGEPNATASLRRRPGIPASNSGQLLAGAGVR
jgi:hypothetical protein